MAFFVVLLRKKNGGESANSLVTSIMIFSIWMINMLARHQRQFQGFARVLRRTLFIQTQTTPNENALKFVPNGAQILPSKETRTIEISNIKDAIHKSDLALKLFSLNDKGISSILFGHDFITVVKQEGDWNVLKPQIFALLTEHLTMGKPVLSENFLNELASEREEYKEELTEEEEVVELIKELLSTRIQPAIQEDGGDIEYVGFDHSTGTVSIKLIGACKSCSSSEITLKSGIEDMLKYYIDEVKEVIKIEEPIIKSEDVDVNAAKTADGVNGMGVQDMRRMSGSDDELPPSL